MNSYKQFYMISSKYNIITIVNKIKCNHTGEINVQYPYKRVLHK